MLNIPDLSSLLLSWYKVSPFFTFTQSFPTPHLLLPIFLYFFQLLQRHLLPLNLIMTPWFKRLPQLPWLWNRNLAPFLSTWDFGELKNGNKIFPSLDACTFAKWLCLSSHREMESLSPPLLLGLAICFDYWDNSKADTYRGFKSSLLLFFGNFRHPCEQISGWQTIQSKGPVILDIPAIINQPNHGHMDTAWTSRRASKLGSPQITDPQVHEPPPLSFGATDDQNQGQGSEAPGWKM